MKEISSKIAIAIDFLKDGKPFTIEDLRLNILDEGTITVTGWSLYINFDNLTKRQSLKELNEIKILFQKMLDLSPDLVDFITGKKVQYFLYFDDYGKGSIPICSEKNGVIKWEIEIDVE